jgi:putative membrane protein
VTLFPYLLLFLYGIHFTALGIHPYDRAVWWAENIPILGIVALLAITFRRFRFTNTSYLMMAFLVFLHTVGGHYTFERVPFGFVTDLFGFTRNHYDRMAHFTVGFYAYPLAELLVRKNMATKWVIYVFPVCFVLAVAAGYEIFEWRFAVSADPKAGIAVLGSQGDVWDAQKDMLADGLGSIFAVFFFYLQSLRPRRTSELV